MPDFHQRPFFIRVLVPTGDPDGLRIVEKSNWPGVGVVFNRTNYKEVVNRGEFDKIHQYMSTLRKDLLAQGVIVDQGQYYAFTQDQVFTSPSTAAGVILGRTANGRIEWKNSDGKTLKQLQTAAADQETNYE